MKFGKILIFIKKRFEEIGFEDEEVNRNLDRIINLLRVKHDSIYYLDSGLIMDPEYEKWGFAEE